MSCTRGSSYIIKAGDTVFILAERELGDGNRWREIMNPNGNLFTEDEARNLRIGQEICLPKGSSPDNGNNMVQEILAAHNKYRAQVGVASLRWSNNLANSAQQWANQLAKMGKLQHSRSGENLSMGTAGRYSLTALVDLWGNEKKYFIPNSTFPNVSNSGKWQDVGHYTQVIWRNTTEVGGGYATNGRDSFLVCHYNPAGNFIGQRVY